MDHLLVVSSCNGISDSILQPLRAAGWIVTVTADIVSAKRLLQTTEVTGVLVELKPDHQLERLKILRFVREFCPHTMVVVLYSGTNAIAAATGPALVQTFDAVGGMGVDRQDSRPSNRLTPAQRRIAELVAQAFPNREIARRLKLKEQSVRNELSRIFKKMGIWSRTELAVCLRMEKHGLAENTSETWKTQKRALRGGVDQERIRLNGGTASV